MTVEGAPATSGDPAFGRGPADQQVRSVIAGARNHGAATSARGGFLGVAEATHDRRRAGRLRKDHRAGGLVPPTRMEPRTRSSPGCRWSAPRTTRLSSGAMSSAPCAGGGSTGGANAEAILRVPGADVGAAVRSLLNDLATADERIVLILDDYHVVSEPTCHELVADLLEHLPAGVRLIIATRSDPPLPLASLRVAGRLAEIRADDLRLTPEETASFVRDHRGPAPGRRRVGVADRPDGGLGRGRPPRGALAPVAAGSACRAPASSPATTGTSSTISASRSSRHSSRTSSASCCRPRS